MSRLKSIVTILMALSMLTAWGGRGIVPSDIAVSGKYALAATFLQRYRDLLDRSADESVCDSIRRVKEDGFRYLLGDDNSLMRLDGDEDFSLSFAVGSYRAAWSESGSPLVACVFPANIGLLTMASKIDLENDLLSRLSSLAGKKSLIERPVRSKSDLQPVTLSDFFVDDKGFYVTPRLRHQLIFSPSEGEECELLVDTGRYQLESLANMMLSGYTLDPKVINLKVSRYGYQNQSLALDFAGFYEALASEGSTPYWGVDTFDGHTLKGLYVWLNQPGGYAHMLTVTLPGDILSGSGQMDARLHCYLRLDNLKSMFEEYPEL